MLPLNQVALLARVVLCFISVYSFISDSVFICIKILERIPNLNSQFVYIFLVVVMLITSFGLGKQVILNCQLYG